MIVGILIVAFVALVLGAILLAVRRGRRTGKRSGLMIAGAFLLGLGQALDPPQERVTEAKAQKQRGPESGEPPLDN